MLVSWFSFCKMLLQEVGLGIQSNSLYYICNFYIQIYSKIKLLLFLKMEKDLNKLFTKQDICIARKHMTRCSTSQLLGKCKLKPLSDIIPNLLKWLTLRRLTIRSADKWKEHLELSHIEDGTTKWYITLENSSAISHKVKLYTYHMIQQSYYHVLPKRNEN